MIKPVVGCIQYDFFVFIDHDHVNMPVSHSVEIYDSVPGLNAQLNQDGCGH